MSELRVALTFDAEHPSRTGSGPDSPQRILDTLAAGGLRATFFVQGRWATAYPELARRVAGDGHVVGNHSNYHAPMTLLLEEGFGVDVQEAEQRIQETAGTDPRPWFRCPFGAGADRPDVLARLGRLGYRNVHWNVDAGDWQANADPAGVVATVMDGVRTRGDRAVVLLHTWSLATAEALPTFLDHLRATGASLVTVEELADVRVTP